MKFTDDTHVLMLTGAGVSAESGIPTFRDMDGLWRSFKIEEVACPEAFIEDPRNVWEFYSARRKHAAPCEPNSGHHAIVKLEERLGDRFLLVTQNVDGLHKRAGSKRVIELHGNLYTSRCSQCNVPFEDTNVYEPGFVPLCGTCGANVRPHIVWFGECINPRAFSQMNAFMDRAQKHDFRFIAAGTSGNVFPASVFVDDAARYGAKTVLVNAEKASNHLAFDRVIIGKSGEVLPKMFSW